ncbi:MAG: glutamate 5-kinase [Thermoleophilia bacterium]|nr:glutamate 5-kinase [Thermoleophilia bacterium]MCZ4496074.1 glutamate 5-kinase [Thermoleophilia bacterium]
MRVVVKIGSSSLVDSSGHRQVGLLGALVDDIASAVAAGHQVVLVSSGAIATGLGILGHTKRPTELPALQAASAVGQGALFASWSSMFELRGLKAGQVLLTMHDAAHRASWVNAKATLEQLLSWGAIPVVNENDTTATDEITFGDNDALAAQVAVALGADRLLLLTDTDGLYTEHPDSPGAELIELVEDHSLLQRVDTATSGSHWGSGGMRSKVIAAEMASAGGTMTHIARAAAPGVVGRILAGEPLGTRIAPRSNIGSAFKLWLRHAKPVRGTIEVDAGARNAIVERGASLLNVGIVGVEGGFHVGDAVELREGATGPAFAKGIVEYDGRELVTLIAVADGRGGRAAIHRDQLVLL